MVNCALQKYRSRSRLHAVVNIDDIIIEKDDNYENTNSKLHVNELIRQVQLLPPGYRMVFNLFVFEKMKHREIAEHLGISEGTS